MERKAGVLLAISSLPGRHGIGDFGKGAYQFADLLKKTDVSIWQILPLNPLASVYSYSPYQSYSCFAGDEVYIDLDQVYEMGLLDEMVPSFHEHEEMVEYPKVKAYKRVYLKRAYEKFKSENTSQQYQVFLDTNPWLDSYAKFMALKTLNEGKEWLVWPEEMQEALYNDYDFSPLQDTIGYYCFVQYLFRLQWQKLKKYVNNLEIEIMGDIPMYVGLDSVDVWQNRKNFLLDDAGNPTSVAGVPPDYFSPNGQRWGNPIYDWKYLKDHGYDFWIQRLQLNQALFDIIRLDHFRAFDTYWTIPASSENAREGKWNLGPSYDFFDTILKALPDIKIVAEDLGDLRQEVLKLKDHYQFYGMLITQFHIMERTVYDDFNIPNHVIVYTGTHDNQTIEGWYEQLNDMDKERIYQIIRHMNCEESNVSKSMIRYSLQSPSDVTIIPLQDILSLNDDARMNVPSTQGGKNWCWRMHDSMICQEQMQWLKYQIEISNRK